MAKKKTKSQASADAPDYESAVEELEAIIDQIESGEAGLEECLAKYERGMKLVTQCRAILDKAEKRIAKLTGDSQGNLRID